MVDHVIGKDLRFLSKDTDHAARNIRKGLWFYDRASFARNIVKKKKEKKRKETFSPQDKRKENRLFPTSPRIRALRDILRFFSLPPQLC